MTTLKEKLEEIKDCFDKKILPEGLCHLVIKALEKSIEQRNEYIFDAYEPYSHALKVIDEDSAELIAILEGVK